MLIWDSSDQSVNHQLSGKTQTPNLQITETPDLLKFRGPPCLVAGKDLYTHSNIVNKRLIVDGECCGVVVGECNSEPAWDG